MTGWLWQMVMRVNRRRKARELALAFMFQMDARGEDMTSAVDEFLSASTDDLEVQGFARTLITTCWANLPAIDDAIRSVSENWELERMAGVDRSILRIAACELLFLDEIPPGVSINEAIDLAKIYSTAQSGAFVNGVLDRIRRERT